MGKEEEELSDKLHDRLKEIYGEGKALDMDRQFEAEETAHPPITPQKVDFWRRDTANRDIEGFDTPSAREPTDKAIIKDIQGGSDLYVAKHNTNANTAHDKFVEPTKYKLGKLIYEERDKILDFESMKKAVIRAWSRDTQVEGLVNNYMKQEDFLSIWRHPIIQGYVEQNTQPILVEYIMAKYRVEPIKASRIANKLSVTNRNKLVGKILRMGSKVRPHKQAITSRRWTAEETRFLQQNRHLPFDTTLRNYRGSFNSQRKDSAIKKKFDSLPKE